MSDIIKKGLDVVMNTYTRFPLVLDKGEGAYVWDIDGKKYLDFVAGIAVNSLGHNNKKLVTALKNQAENIIHCSNLYWTVPQISIAEKLTANSCMASAFFCNSGAESIEAALKLAKKYGYEQERSEIITMKNSFHGRTLGAVTATGQDKYQKGFAPLLPNIKYGEFNNLDSIKNIVTDKTIAIIVEPIQGEGGIKPASKDFLDGLRQLCDEKDMLLIFDEVQCGVGRTGKLFASEYYNVNPDAIAIAKGLAGGVPIGMLLVTEKLKNVLGPGEHASTFGGNPLATAGANVVVDELLGGLLNNITDNGNYLSKKLTELESKYDCIVDVRGVGFMQGIELNRPVGDIITKAMENGLLLVGSGANVIRFVPPLNIGKNEIDEMICILDKSIGEVK